ncbi:MAG: phage portal protein, partial [Oscillospiraceae bacterium]|nr:phage portal protein [Oscillospiraceae bacterium]
MLNISFSICDAAGLGDHEREQLHDLVETFNHYAPGNKRKNKFYEGHVTLGEVNLGIALPHGMRGLEIGCEWGAKTVDVLASRSMFDGFVGASGQEAEAMRDIMDANRLRAEYAKACRDELKFGCTFATLSADPDIACRIQFHSPMTASALWDASAGRIDCGMCVLDTFKDATNPVTGYKPSKIRFDTDTAVWILTATDETGQKWVAEAHPHRMGRPLMEPLIWNATHAKPLGRSRLKKPVRELIKGYVRTVANATIGLEFATAPQKYLLGVTDDQYDAVISNSFRQYIGSILAASTNPETGSNPVFGQLQQGSIEPHVQMLRVLATQFSAATGLSVTDTGVVNDANPTSSDAIIAQTQSLIL